MSLLSLQKISLAFGHLPILHEVDLELHKGERVCLVGRNGAGKSTLFNVICGLQAFDDGKRWQPDTLKIAYLAQDVPADSEKTVYELIAEGLGELGTLLNQYHRLSETNDSDPARLQQMANIQHEIELHGAWNLNQKVETVISRLQLPADKTLRACSGGLRRKALLARALVSEPDLLLLDEPTNHMDIAAIAWLEDFLLAYNGTLVFITHDRTFLKNLATRIIELDRGVLRSFNGNYDNYLQKKEEILNAEEKAHARFDKQLAEHEAWIRKGIKARRTRNQGRVKKLLDMRAQRAARVEPTHQAKFNVAAGEMSGKLVADLRHVSIQFDHHHIIDDFSTRLLRGDRVGIIGPNGCGKSTLLKLLLGELKPDSGQIVLGTKLETAYFDQKREQLLLDKTVKENISDGHDYVNVKGRSRHVIGYLKDFLFPPEKIDAPVKILSGGEKNRLLLARLFTHTSNMLVLDEPTNDLDVDTLELLEDLLSDYEGTLLLVSHDRSFLDNIVTSTIVFGEQGQVHEYVGGYEDYLRQKPKLDPIVESNMTPKAQKTKTPEKKAKTKLSYKEQRELEQLPTLIEDMEETLQSLEQQVSQPEFYQQEKQTITKTLDELEQTRQSLQKAYERWEQLEAFV